MKYSFILAANGKDVSWSVILFVLAASAAWDCYSGTTRFGRYFEFDRDDSTSQYIILVGLKIVAVLLIAMVMFTTR